MDKRGYFFIMDALLGVSIMIASGMYFYSLHSYEQPKGQIYILADNMIGFLSDSELAVINNNYKDKLVLDGNITRIDNTIFEQINEFEYREKRLGCAYCYNLSRELLKNITAGIIESQYNFRIAVDNRTIYERSIIDEKASILTLRTSRIVYNIFNSTDVYGPTFMEVSLWQ